MTSYRGVVKDNTVVVEEGARLPEGATVEVWLVEPPLSRDEAFARVLANPIRYSVGMEEILDEDKREREERADRWLQESNGR